MLLVQIPAPPKCMSKCPWARYWTPNCSWQSLPSMYGSMNPFIESLWTKALAKCLNENENWLLLRRSCGHQQGVTTASSRWRPSMLCELSSGYLEPEGLQRLWLLKHKPGSWRGSGLSVGLGVRVRTFTQTRLRKKKQDWHQALDKIWGAPQTKIRHLDCRGCCGC